jgi:hypothetical protein
LTSRVTDAMPWGVPGYTPLSAELEALLLRELSVEWKHLNQSYFKGALKRPSLELVTHESRLGRWDRETRTIELSRPFVLSHGWGVVVEVLKHEMAHQYVHEVLGEALEAPHGPAFREVCHRLGIDAAARGVPRTIAGDAAAGDNGSPHATDGEQRIVERVARLLALAESPNTHEAQAAASAAQRLMLKYNLEVRKSAEALGYAFAHVGRSTGRVNESERILAMLLGKHFFVEVIWVPVYRPLEGRRGSILELCGTPANLAMAEYVHIYLTRTADQLWIDHKMAKGVESNRDRRTFLAGVMTGFADKLAREASANRERGLVWIGDGDLARFFRRRHPHIRHVRHMGTRKNETYAHGREAGRRIVLRRAVEAAATSWGRLLSR